MHVLGHSFSQRRKSTKRPRDLHIRKISFSGSSLSSGCSLSSSSSTSTFTARTPLPDRVGLDPLHQNPAHHAPPRLNERPFIKTQRESYEESATFYDDEDDEDEGDDFDDDEVEFEMMTRKSHTEQPRDMELPPHSSPMDHTEHDIQEPQDYFLLQLAQRPPLNRSHWSESTIQTIDHGLSTPGSGIATPSEATTATPEPVVFMPPNFSYKRSTAPKRPPFAAADTVDNFIKRGGWKRRGIVFNGEEVDGSDEGSSDDDDEEEARE